MLETLRSNPSRVVDWRWQRACQWGEDPCDALKPRVRRDGRDGSKWINKAIRFKALYDETEDDKDRACLSDQFPAMFWAHSIYQDDGNPQKYAIEAYILAREKDHEVGFRAGCAPEIVEAYEAVFFNVRDKLRHMSYIINVVLGDAIHRGLHDRRYDLLWKLCAYQGGPYVLDMLISKYSQIAWASDPSAVGAYWQDTAINALKMKAALASLTVPVNSQTNLHLLDIFNKYVEIERSTDTQGQQQAAVLENLQAMMQNLPYSMAGQSEDETRHLIHYNAVGAELRYEELMIVSAGHELPYAKELEAIGYPQEEAVDD